MRYNICITFKNGKELSVECDECTVNKNIAKNSVVGITWKGLTDEAPMFINLDEIVFITQKTVDNTSSSTDKKGESLNNLKEINRKISETQPKPESKTNKFNNEYDYTKTNSNNCYGEVCKDCIYSAPIYGSDKVKCLSNGDCFVKTAYRLKFK